MDVLECRQGASQATASRSRWNPDRCSPNDLRLAVERPTGLQPGAEGAAPGADAGAAGSGEQAKADDDVVDAEFEEVDDNKK